MVDKSILRYELILAYINNQDKGIKFIEHALQDTIEKAFPAHLWWEVCKVNIFMELYGGTKPEVLIENIVDDCLEP